MRTMGPHQFVVLQLFGVDAVGVPDVSVHLSDAHALGTIAVQVTHRVQAHVTETLQWNNIRTYF